MGMVVRNAARARQWGPDIDLIGPPASGSRRMMFWAGILAGWLCSGPRGDNSPPNAQKLVLLLPSYSGVSTCIQPSRLDLGRNSFLVHGCCCC